jgi:soluble lytic murein transglycosylase-like protein
MMTKAASPTGKAAGLDEKSRARLEKAVQEFESLFVGYLLKTMRSSIPKSDLFGESFGGDILESMFDLEMAKHISRNSSLGLGEMLYKQIAGEQFRHDAASPARTRAADADTVRNRIESYRDVIQDAAEKHSLDANLLKAVIATESGGDTSARSGKDAKGLMQLLDSTAVAMGVKNVWDPRENILGGAKYLKQLLDRFNGDTKLALASYNAGPGAVEKHKGIPPYNETREYVNEVLNYLQVFGNEGSNDGDNQ